MASLSSWALFAAAAALLLPRAAGIECIRITQKVYMENTSANIAALSSWGELSKEACFHATASLEPCSNQKMAEAAYGRTLGLVGNDAGNQAPRNWCWLNAPCTVTTQPSPPPDPNRNCN